MLVHSVPNMSEKVTSVMKTISIGTALIAKYQRQQQSQLGPHPSLSRRLTVRQEGSNRTYSSKELLQRYASLCEKNSTKGSSYVTCYGQGRLGNTLKQISRCVGLARAMSRPYVRLFLRDKEAKDVGTLFDFPKLLPAGKPAKCVLASRNYSDLGLPFDWYTYSLSRVVI